MSNSIFDDDQYEVEPKIDFEWVKTLFRKDFTYNDYKNWPENVHAEIIDGQVYLMAAPNERHTFIQSEISYQLIHYFRGKTCLIYTAKFGVRLDYKESGLDTTTVEPDIFIVCDQSIVRGKATCEGTPDFILEIVSKGEAKRTCRGKHPLFIKKIV